MNLNETRSPVGTMSEVHISQKPDFDGLIDEDILKRFENTAVFYGDIINAQLIKTNRLLITELHNMVAALQKMQPYYEEDGSVTIPCREFK